MKKPAITLFALLALMVGGCTYHTKLPLIVGEVTLSNVNDVYEIRLWDEDHVSSAVVLYTSHKYNVGDTIQ